MVLPSRRTATIQRGYKSIHTMNISPKVYSWSQPVDYCVGDPSGLEAQTYLNPIQQQNLFVTGVGMRVHGNNVTDVVLQVAPINSDGTLGERQLYPPGAKIELLAQVPASNNEVVVGIAVGAHGGNMTSLAIYTRAIDPYLGVLSPLVNTYVAPGGGTSFDQTWIADEGDSTAEATVITGIAGRYHNNGLVALGVQASAMSVQLNLATCPFRSSLKSMRQLQQESPEDLETLQRMTLYAKDAYQTVCPDNFFSCGTNMRLDGTFYSAPSKSAWLTANHYLAIINPGADPTNPLLYNWGIIATATATPGELIVAFRGTVAVLNPKVTNPQDLVFQEWFLTSDIATDAAGATVDITEFQSGGVEVLMDLTTFGGQSANVHSGFLAAYQGLRMYLRSQLSSLLSSSSYTKVRFTGHSLGGALACLAAVDMSTNPITASDPAVECWTMGCPMVGDSNFIALLNRLAGYHLCRSSCWTDVVPCVPALGYISGSSNTINFEAAANQVSIASESYPLFFTGHFLAAYYVDLLNVTGAVVAPGWNPSTVILSANLTINTGGKWFAGTDEDVTITLIGTPTTIDGAGSAFESNSSYSTPAQTPNGALISQLAGSVVKVVLAENGAGWAPEWFLKSIAIQVNGLAFTNLVFNEWIGPGSSISAPIDKIGT